MTTLRYLSDPTMAGLLLPGIVAALAIAVLCAGLSTLVVLKRMAFIGQGISHAAFGGIGVAAVLGLAASPSGPAPAGGLWQFLIVTAFCLAAALGVGWIARRGRTEPDTAIGIILVGSMALGAILLGFARSGVAWESILFGSVLNASWTETALAVALTLAVAAILVHVRRPMLFWGFDEPAAEAFGVSVRAMRLLLLLLLALATVAAMRLAGVVLATALLVLPAAGALRTSRRLGAVLARSVSIGVVGVSGGLVLSFEAGLQPGASIVMVLALLFGGACAVGRRSGAGVG